MRRESHYIDNVFKEGFRDAEVMPPHDAWLNINNRLDKKNRAVMFYTYSGIAASIALLIGVASFYIDRPFHFSDNIVIVNLIHNPIDGNTIKVEKIVNSNLGKDLTDNKNKKSFVVIESHSLVENKTVTLKGVNVVKNDASLIQNENLKVAESAKNANEQETVKDTDVLVRNTVVVENVIKKSPETILEGKETFNSTFLSKKNSELFYEELPTVQNQQEVVVSEKKNEHSWSVECQAAPMYSFRNISKVNSDLPGESGFNQNEEPLMTYSGGLKVSYQTNRRLSFQAGLYYSVLGQQVNNVYEKTTSSNNVVLANIVEDTPHKIITNNSFGAVTTDMETRANSIDAVTTVIDNSKLVQQFKYLEIPILARYKIIDRRISCHMVGGLSTNFLVDNKSIFEENGTKTTTGSTPNIRKMNYSSTVGFGINYSLFSNVNLSFEPTCKYYLSSISTNNDIKVHPYAFGVFTGLVYHF